MNDVFEWDEAKRRRNLELHGVDFAIAREMAWDRAMTFDQQRNDELRHLSYVPAGSRIHAIVWTARGGKIRIISLRKANSREVSRYEKAQEADGDRGPRH